MCLHGWLDNAASFHLLAPAIHSRLATTSSNNPNNNIHVLALDNPGHGYSSHKSPDGPTQLISEYTLYLSEALASLRWIDHSDSNNNGNNGAKSDGDDDSTSNSSGGITLIGHSMGAAVALMYAAAFPEHVDKVVLLDGFGPMARRSSDVSKHIRSAIERRLSSNRNLYGDDQNTSSMKRSTRGRSLDQSVSLRMKSASLLPGNQYISRDAARAIVCRATVPVVDDGERNAATAYAADNDASLLPHTTGTGPHPAQQQSQHPSSSRELYMSTYAGLVKFHHDQRLHWPSLHYFTPEQVDVIYRDVRCPVCLLHATDGWPADPRSIDSIGAILRPVVTKELKGSHYFHADPETAEAVIDEVVRFLE